MKYEVLGLGMRALALLALDGDDALAAEEGATTARIASAVADARLM